MKRVRRPPTVEGLSVEEFIRRNEDPICLYQNEMWEYIEENKQNDLQAILGDANGSGSNEHNDDDDSCPF